MIRKTQIISYILLIIGLNTESFNYINQGRDWPSDDNVCNGSRQSPIDFYMDPPLNCSTRAITVEFNPNKIQSTIDPDLALRTVGEFATVFLKSGSDSVLEYKALQFHIHSPSEHTVNGKNYDAEMHLVLEVISADKDKTQNTLTVLGFFLQNMMEDENLFLKSWNVLDNIGKTFELNFEEIQKAIDSKQLNEYYTYLGSLTTPKCTEIVNWFVFKNPLNYSKAQKDLFDGFFKNKGNGNNRYPQDLNGRTVTTGTLQDCSFSHLVYLSNFILALLYIFK
jgi:carbonic anhydrase